MILHPTASIVTPSYNQGAYIESTIQSVITQDYPNIEYLVMDAASTDNTLDLLREYSARHPDKMRYVSEKDRGQTHALNKAIAQTHGPIIGWLNSDDTFAPGAISTAMQFFAAHPDVDLLYGNANFTDPQDRIIAPCAHVEPYNWHRFVHYSDFIVQPAAFFTRRAFDAVGGADESIHYAMDYDLFLKIASRFKVAYLPKVLANYKWFGENKTALGGWDRLGEIERIAGAFGARGLPAYTRIEAAFLDVRLAMTEARHARAVQATKYLAAAANQVCFSPRVWRSLVSPACWKVIWNGQLLRRAGRAMRDNLPKSP